MRVLNIYHIFPDVLGVDRCVFPREGGAKDVYQAVHQITPHIHMMWFDTIFIPPLSNHTTFYIFISYTQYQGVHQIMPHIHMMWFDTIFIPSNHTTTYNNIFIYSISEEYSLNHATHPYDAVWHHIHNIKSHHIRITT